MYIICNNHCKSLAGFKNQSFSQEPKTLTKSVSDGHACLTSQQSSAIQKYDLTSHLHSLTLKPPTGFIQLISPDLFYPICNKICRNRTKLSKDKNLTITMFTPISNQNSFCGSL